MKARRLWLLAALPLIAACAKSDDDAPDGRAAAGNDTVATLEPSVPSADTGSTPMATMAMVTLDPVGGSGVQGAVNFSPDPASAGRVVGLVTVTGGTAGGVHPSHVHTGTCDAPGAVVFPLGEITITEGGGGQSEAPIEADAATLANGTHIVAVHEAGGSPGAPIACGPIVMHSM